MSAKSNVERISLDSVNETSVRCALIAVAILLLTVFPVAAQDLAIGLHPLERNVAPPTLTERVRVTYTPEAKGAEVTGWIDLQVHVRSDGTVGDVEIVTSCLGRIGGQREPNGDPFQCRSADDYERVGEAYRVNGFDSSFGMDEQAVTSMRELVFTPGMREGNPVAVRMIAKLTLHPTSPE